MTNKRIVLITGASKGIGRAAALEAARRGMHVIALARSTEALEKLDDEIRALSGEGATLITLDLKDQDSIDGLAAPLLERFGQLDGLIANAGMLGTIGPIQTVSPRSFEDTIKVNLMANWRLIRSLHPLLKASEAGRAVFVTSGVAVGPRAYWGPYQAAKMGMEGLVRAWAEENEQSSLRVNLFDPGPTATDMRAEAMPGEDPATLPSAENVAATIVDCVEATFTKHNERVVYRQI